MVTTGRIIAGGLMIGACMWAAHLQSQSDPALCADGHPAKRRPDVTYGGLAPRHGYQRDHRISLCLGGPDTRANVWYQPLAEAHEKDRVEHWLCEQVCAGTMELTEARSKESAWRETYAQIFGEVPR
jgi:hypothetical protein